MTFREKAGYLLMLIIMIALCIVAAKISTTGLGRINKLLKKGEQVEAEVIRIEENGKKLYTPIFRFRLNDGSVKEYGNALLYGDLYSRGDKIDYIFHPEKPEYSKPKTFIRLYGALILAVFACLFCLSFIVMISLKLLSISYSNNKIYGLVTMTTTLMATIIVGALANFEITRTSNLLKGGIQTTAKVLRFDKTTRKGGKSAKFPVFSFTDANGLNREIRQNWSGSGDLKLGEVVEIIYNPEYATIARRNSFWYIYGASILFAFLFLSFLGYTIYCLKRLW